MKNAKYAANAAIFFVKNGNNAKKATNALRIGLRNENSHKRYGLRRVDEGEYKKKPAD